MSALPLEGLKIVEFSHMVMGPSCGLLLADMGADVIKVEPLGAGDKTRQLSGSGIGFFAAFNRNKRSLALDLKSAAGLRLARELIAQADVLTENFRPGALAAMDLDYETLSQTNPRLIYCSMKGFLEGPYANRTALDEVVQMMGGLAYMTGPPGRPLRAGASVNDIMGGMFAAIGILGAVIQRATTGRGQKVCSSLFENTAFLMATHLAQFVISGKPPAPMPSRLAAWGIYDVFETSDEQVFLAVVSDTQWRAFCQAFHLETLAADPGLATNPQRVAGRERMMPVLRELFKTLPRAAIMAACEKAGLPFAPVARPQDLLEDPQLATQGAMVEVTLPDGRAMPVPALPLEMDGRRFGRRRDLPRVGEHSAEILAALGYAPEEIAAMAKEGVIGVDHPV